MCYALLPNNLPSECDGCNAKFSIDSVNVPLRLIYIDQFSLYVHSVSINTTDGKVQNESSSV